MANIIDSIRPHIVSWAQTLPYPVRISFFGSRLKGTARPDSDLDLSLEFLDDTTETERTLRWCKYHSNWQNHLTAILSFDVHLSIHEGSDSPTMQAAHNEASEVLFDSGQVS